MCHSGPGRLLTRSEFARRSHAIKPLAMTMPTPRTMYPAIWSSTADNVMPDTPFWLARLITQSARYRALLRRAIPSRLCRFEGGRSGHGSANSHPDTDRIARYCGASVFPLSPLRGGPLGPRLRKRPFQRRSDRALFCGASGRDQGRVPSSRRDFGPIKPLIRGTLPGRIGGPFA